MSVFKFTQHNIFFMYIPVPVSLQDFLVFVLSYSHGNYGYRFTGNVKMVGRNRIRNI
jgi:hypothetical protein